MNCLPGISSPAGSLSCTLMSFSLSERKEGQDGIHPGRLSQHSQLHQHKHISLITISNNLKTGCSQPSSSGRQTQTRDQLLWVPKLLLPGVERCEDRLSSGGCQLGEKAEGEEGLALGQGGAGLLGTRVFVPVPPAQGCLGTQGGTRAQAAGVRHQGKG